MKTITLKYGLSKSLNGIEVDEDASVYSIVGDYGHLLGLPESYTVLVNGVVSSTSYVPESGDVISFEKVACQKA